MTEIIGRAGDGMKFVARRDRTGSLHFVFRTSRLASDLGPATYARWEGSSLTREPIDPTAEISVALELTPEQTPVVMAQPWADPTGRARLLQRTPRGWTCYATLPADSKYFFNHFALAPDGTVLLASWDPQRRAALLWRGRDANWKVETIAREPDKSDPNWFTIAIDRRGKPLVVIARLDIPHGWIKLAREP
jgi:hypothetical protein